jgi:uncharacterized membrane protein YozB (DUF420 family)
VTLSFPNKGFFGTGATFAADLNLVVQFIIGAALIAGAFLAKQKRYKAHAVCQTTVLLFNLLMIGLVMEPSFHQQMKFGIRKVFRNQYYATATIHAALGTSAELFGLYIVIMAGTNLMPQWLRCKHWKALMRTELALWLIVLISGALTYYTWYIKPFQRAFNLQ